MKRRVKSICLKEVSSCPDCGLKLEKSYVPSVHHGSRMDSKWENQTNCVSCNKVWGRHIEHLVEVTTPPIKTVNCERY